MRGRRIICQYWFKSYLWDVEYCICSADNNLKGSCRTYLNLFRGEIKVTGGYRDTSIIDK